APKRKRGHAVVGTGFSRDVLRRATSKPTASQLKLAPTKSKSAGIALQEPASAVMLVCVGAGPGRGVEDPVARAQVVAQRTRYGTDGDADRGPFADQREQPHAHRIRAIVEREAAGHRGEITQQLAASAAIAALACERVAAVE